jgi:5-methylcytosine-specific restriction protein A
MLDAQGLQHAVQTRFGIAFAVQRQITTEGPVYRIQPADLAPTIGFTVDIQIGWRSLETRFLPGPFAAELVWAMEHSDAQQRVAFRIFADATQKAGASLLFRINSVRVDPVSESWPSEWKACDVSMRRSNIHWGEDAASDDEQLRGWTCRFLGLIVALLPLEPVEPAAAGEVEGQVIEAVSKRYERSRLNRAACIEIQGSRCVVCSFDFGSTYGPIGEGFIHVHHVTSIATAGPGTVIDPSRDLVPVCPNCHAMLHSSRPPLLPDTLRALLNDRRAQLRT